MRFILGVLGVVALIIILVVLIVGRNPGTERSLETGRSQQQLAEYVQKNSWVVQTTYGPVVGEDQRRAVRITVSPSQRRIEVLQGYQETVIDSKTYSNNTAAYDTFMRAIDGAGFLKDQELPEGVDRQAVCPTGQQYSYELHDSGTLVSNLWSNSCNRTQATFIGNGPLVRRLFQRQIPDYTDIAGGVALY